MNDYIAYTSEWIYVDSTCYYIKSIVWLLIISKFTPNRCFFTLVTHKPAEANKVLILLAAVTIVLTGLHFAQDFFIPLALAFFIAAVSFPIMNWLREHKVPRFLSVLMTVFVYKLNES